MSTSTHEDEALSPEEIVHLGAVDPVFYSSYFFSRAFRQKTPEFHRKIWEKLNNPENRYVAIKVFRGGAKTTLLRTFTSRRIAYGLSHTILFISEAQAHAVKSVEWVAGQVMHNEAWASLFNLKKGKKWASDEIEILHGVEEFPIRVIALGLEGQTRGVNIDDFRPDLIIVDDPCDEENTGTPEYREKISNLFFGSIEKSLAPESECQDAKMVLLQTPLQREDLIESCMLDPQWATETFSCFKDDGTSQWPERWTTEVLNKQKEAHIARNQLALWLREMECKVTSAETSSFLINWLQYWEILPPRNEMTVYIGVDPTPPPKDNQQLGSINTSKLDDAVILAIGVHRGKIYLLDYYKTKSPNPDEFINKIFNFQLEYKPFKLGFESILFARTTKHYLEKEQQKRRHYFTVTPVEDKRKKRIRIEQAINARASARNIYVHKSHLEFIEQFGSYPDVSHDDLLDAFAIALDLISPYVESEAIEGEYERIMEDEKHIPALPQGWRDCP